jgi:hypothetical protein
MTKAIKRFIHIIPVALATGCLLSACSNAPEEKFSTITLNGSIRMVAGPVPAGTIHFRLYNLESLSVSEELQHPLSEIEDFESETAQFSHTFEYPLHRGEGLAVHAWLDADGDGIFCTPEKRVDPSGMSWVGDTPEGSIEMSITLSDNCRAANWFYPPKS